MSLCLSDVSLWVSPSQISQEGVIGEFWLGWEVCASTHQCRARVKPNSADVLTRHGATR